MTAPARMLVTLSVDELRQLVRDEVERAIGERGDEGLIDAQAVAEMLHISRDTVRDLVRREGLPAYRVGRSWMFKRAEVLAWLEDRAEKPRSHAGRHLATIRRLR